MGAAIMGYFGSKHRLAQRLIALMPAHRGYVEPFAGSLSVLAAKPASPIEVANDLNGDLMTFWRVLRDRADDLELACLLTPHGREEHANSFDLQPEPYDEVEHARRVWVRLAQGRAGQFTPTGWRHHQSTQKVNDGGMVKRLTNYIGRFAEVAERLRNVSLECRPAEDVIAAYGRDPGTLLYVDPPYLGSTRPNNTNGYAVELNSEPQHRDLAESLRSCEAMVMLSGYPSPLYDDLYDGWHRTDLSAWTGQGNRKAARTEVVWSNRELVVAQASA
jgi:DNA adenine methylase